MPPAKLESDPCSDKPTAKPAAPRMATNEVVSMPNFEIKVTNNNTRITQRRMSAKNRDKVGSKSRLTIILRTILLINRIA